MHLSMWRITYNAHCRQMLKNNSFLCASVRLCAYLCACMRSGSLLCDCNKGVCMLCIANCTHNCIVGCSMRDDGICHSLIFNFSPMYLCENRDLEERGKRRLLLTRRFSLFFPYYFESKWCDVEDDDIVLQQYTQSIHIPMSAAAWKRGFLSISVQRCKE